MYCSSAGDDVTHTGGCACVIHEHTINYEGLKPLWMSTGIPESNGPGKVRDDEAEKTSRNRKR